MDTRTPQEKIMGLQNNDADEKTPLVTKTPADAEKGGTSSGLSKQQVCYAASGFLIVFGVVFFMHTEDWQFLTSLYVITQIVTTIGYGDLTVTSDTTKLVMSFYALFVLIMVAYSLNSIAQQVIDRETRAVRQRLRKRNTAANAQLSRRNTEEQVQEIQSQLESRGRREFYAAALIFFAFVLFGTIFFGTYEACTCSYGVSGVQGCDRSSYKTCAATGGYKKSFVEAWYMSMITLTTIGFGDHTPRSHVGRIVGIFWMLFGVIATANFVDKISKLFHEDDHDKKVTNCMAVSKDVFEKMDTDGSGFLSKAEFLSYTLVQYGVVNEDLLNEIGALFDKIDVKGDNKLTYNMIAANSDGGGASSKQSDEQA